MSSTDAPTEDQIEAAKLYIRIAESRGRPVPESARQIASAAPRAVASISTSGPTDSVSAVHPTAQASVSAQAERLTPAPVVLGKDERAAFQALAAELHDLVETYEGPVEQRHELIEVADQLDSALETGQASRRLVTRMAYALQGIVGSGVTAALLQEIIRISK